MNGSGHHSLLRGRYGHLGGGGRREEKECGGRRREEVVRVGKVVHNAADDDIMDIMT